MGLGSIFKYAAIGLMGIRPAIDRSHIHFFGTGYENYPAAAGDDIHGNGFGFIRYIWTFQRVLHNPYRDGYKRGSAHFLLVSPAAVPGRGMVFCGNGHPVPYLPVVPNRCTLFVFLTFGINYVVHQQMEGKALINRYLARRNKRLTYAIFCVFLASGMVVPTYSTPPGNTE